MATVTVVLGLCGSGKTTFVKNLVGVTVFDEGVAPGWPKHVDFQNALAAGEDCAVVEIAYCSMTARDEFVRHVLSIRPDTKFNWVCFENDLEAANASCRADVSRTSELIRGNVSLNQRISAAYSYPSGAIVLRVRAVG
jgi:hypothetical protein